MTLIFQHCFEEKTLTRRSDSANILCGTWTYPSEGTQKIFIKDRDSYTAVAAYLVKGHKIMVSLCIVFITY